MQSREQFFTRSTVFLVFLATSAFGQSNYAPDDSAWRFEGDQVSVSSIGGQSAIKIRNGVAYLDGVNMQDGEIRFDVFTSGQRAFVYVLFRGQSPTEYEDLYLRPHKSELPDAVQYSPVFQRQSAWQLYHGVNGTAAATLPPNEWIAVRIKLAGARAQVWIGDDDTPVLTVNRLGRLPEAGWIALRGFVPGTSPAEYAAYFRNISVEQLEQRAVVSQEEDPVLPDGVITAWKVSPAFDAPPGPIVEIAEGVLRSEWSVPPMQPGGVFEFLRSRTIPPGSRHWAVVAESILHSEKSQMCAMHFGYSDEITLSLNNQLILYQDSSYRFAAPRQDGVMHPNQVTAFLPLKQGDNRVQAVIADRFGGWGLVARIEDCPGVSALER